ncbi:MAG TPA: type II secretion system protein GspM [Steroidobacteraceae bacterium]|nr:type II secretion system protein GspM [Steroidobacteraceae bacterium]
MKGSALQALARLNERERRLVLLGGAIALLLLIVVVLMPLQASLSAGARRIEHKRDDLSWLQSVAPQLGSLTLTSPAPLRESLVALVDRTARDAAMAKSLVGSQPSGNGGLTVRLEQAPFDSLVTWLSQLSERYGVHAESATLEAASMPGTVNATLVLRAR